MASIKFEHLGNKCLWIYILSMMTPLVVILLLGIVIPIFQNQFPEVAQSYLGAVYSILFVLFVVTGLMACLVGYLKYITYKFALDEDALRIERGILNREILAIPYRQIQDINIDRSLLNRLLGVSNVVITTAASEEKDDDGNDQFEAEGTLPLLDAHRAEEIQSELLKRTNVEKVISVNQK